MYFSVGFSFSRLRHLGDLTWSILSSWDWQHVHGLVHFDRLRERPKSHFVVNFIKGLQEINQIVAVSIHSLLSWRIGYSGTLRSDFYVKIEAHWPWHRRTIIASGCGLRSHSRMSLLRGGRSRMRWGSRIGRRRFLSVDHTSRGYRNGGRRGGIGSRWRSHSHCSYFHPSECAIM